MQEIIDKILKESKNIAVVGLSPDPSKISYKIAKFLQDKKFKIYPVYPKEEEILNERVYRALNEIEDKIDLVLMFRKGEFANELFPVVVDKKIPNFWLQLGIFNDEVAKKCENLGINFIQNRCIMVEYQKQEK
ncbi:MAG: CoA-binding protein [Campylobacter sp.]|nr:CoA-binding protein [Campylobacter sp.]